MKQKKTWLLHPCSHVFISRGVERNGARYSLAERRNTHPFSSNSIFATLHSLDKLNV